MKKTLKICDASLTKGFSFLFSSMGRTADMAVMAGFMDELAFDCVEICSGESFKITHRFLNEDPWERIRLLGKLFKKTPISISLKGNSLDGTNICPESVVDSFVERLSASKISIVKLSDSLNDTKNFLYTSKRLKSEGLRFQGVIYYSKTTEGNIEQEKIFTPDYYIEKIKELELMGAESVWIEEPAGILSPYDCYELVSIIKENTSLPVSLSLSCSSGMGLMALLKGVEAGADSIETCIGPFSMRNSLPCPEPFVKAFENKTLDIKKLGDFSLFLENEIIPKYRFYLDEKNVFMKDANIFNYGLNKKLVSWISVQLRDLNSNTDMEEVLKAVSFVRKDSGNIPLVPPFDRIIAQQAVNNVVFGEYNIISDHIAKIVKGKYGKTPGKISEKLKAQVDQKFSDFSSDGMSVLDISEAGRNIKGFAVDIEDELIYALFPRTGKRFLKWKYHKEEAPEKTRPVSLEDAKSIFDEIERLKQGKTSDGKVSDAPEKSPATRNFNVFIDDDYFEVAVDPGGTPFVNFSTFSPPKSTYMVQKSEDKIIPGTKNFQEPFTGEKKKENDDLDFVFIKAPMPGSIVSLRKKTGEHVRKDEVVVILEAMKMENPLRSPVSGIVKEIRCSGGDQVPKDFVLCVIDSRKEI